MYLQEIKKKYHHAKISCCSEHCNVKIDTKKNHIILKGERLIQKQSRKICDCIIFQNDKKIIVIELKSKSINTSDIHEKLCNGGKESLCILGSSGHKSNFTLYFVLLAQSYTSSSMFQKLRSYKININGKRHNILAKKCGCSLQSIIN